MANPKQLEILIQGSDIWNSWRQRKGSIVPDLTGANLLRANLRGAHLEEADLSEADLSEADLEIADLSRANLRGAELMRASLRGAILWKADLSGANLRGAELWAADLSEANLSIADLNETGLTNAELTNSTIGTTTFANVDIYYANGLNTINHNSPSTIGTDTIMRAQGKLPELFLRGCGLSDLDIEYAKLYNHDLSNQAIDEILYKIHDLRANQSLQISPLFISYSRTDNNFVDKVEAQLDKLGVRYWRDVHHATAGPLEKQVDMAIRHNPTVLLILSESSVNSDWVEHEVRKARELAKELGRDVLCPVALDNSWKSSPWPKHLMEQVMEYNILDFSQWKDKSVFEKQFRKLIDGLDLFYK